MARMNKKYYGCWLFWFIVPEDLRASDDQPVSSSPAGETGKRKKLIVIPGSAAVPAQMRDLSRFYDFMELCTLDEKISAGSEFTGITVSERDAFEEARKRLREDEGSLFDEKGALSPEVKIVHKVPIALPLWEGAYDFRGGRECLFFIDGQKGNIIGEEFTKDSRSHIFGYVPYIAGALVLLLIIVLLSVVPFSGSGKSSPEPSPSVTATEAASQSQGAPSLSPEIRPSESSSPVATAPSASLSPTSDVTASPAQASPEVSSSPVLLSDGESLKIKETVAENFKAISRKDFKTVLGLRTESVKSTRSVSEYEAIYRDNISIDLVDATVTECAEGEARINVTLLSRDSFEGKEVDSTYKGWFLLKKENGEWRIHDSNLSKKE